LSDLLELRSVSVFYGARTALDCVSLNVPQGAQIAVVGPNGAGKSTLFKALVGLVPLQRGEILMNGRPRADFREPIAYVPQREEVDWRFPVTVWDVVSMGRYGGGRWLRRLSHADRAAVRGGLESLGIADLADRSIGELSGGQQQRVFLARALAQEPRLLLLDEPFTGVDISTRQVTLELLAGLREKSVTVLVSTHDLDLAASRFDQVALLRGCLIGMGTPGVVFTQTHLQAAFGGQMMVVNGTTIVVDQCCGGHGPVGGVDGCGCDSCEGEERAVGAPGVDHEGAGR
jgi:ABC-type Mn2+/Zn2+ transport system ATPase subunit